MCRDELNGPSVGDRVLSVECPKWHRNAFCYDCVVARNMP